MRKEELNANLKGPEDIREGMRPPVPKGIKDTAL
jgi:hypothetical protein